MKHRKLWLQLRMVMIVAAVLTLAILACGRGQGQEPDEPEDAEEEVDEAEETDDEEDEAEEEDLEPIEGPGGCTDDMAFIVDVSVPDDTVFGPNEPFTKTWRLQNTGDCDWSGYQLIFLDGEPMGTMIQDIPDMPAGEEFDISIEMTSPGGVGDYTGRWQVISSEGYSLGTITCIITVQAGEADEEPVEEEPEVEEEETEEEPAAGAPAAPSNLTMPEWSMTTITLAWQDNSDDEDGFRVRDGDQTTLAEVGPDVTTVVIDAPPCGETYRIHVRAFNAAGRSAFSNMIEAEGTCVGQEDAIPEAPSNLSAIGGAVGGESFVNVTWTDNGDNEDGFRVVDRDLGMLAETGPDTEFVQLSEDEIEECTVLHLRVRAFNDAGISPFSDMFEVIMPGDCN